MSFAPDFEIEDTYILGDYNYIYTVVTFADDVSDYADGFTFDVYLDGELYYGSMTPEIDEQYLFCDLTLDGPLDSGSYTVSVCYNGEEITSASVDIDNTNTGWSSGSGSGSSTPDSIEGDVYLCYADCTSSFVGILAKDGLDLDYEGTIGIWFELTLSDDGEYTITYDDATFGADLIDFFTENKDQIMMGFYGLSSVDDLEEYEESLGSDTYKALESTMIQACVETYSDTYAAFYDYGTYTIDGDAITFNSTDFGDFDGTIGDGMITLDPDDTSLNDGGPMEFYLEG